MTAGIKMLLGPLETLKASQDLLVSFASVKLFSINFLHLFKKLSDFQKFYSLQTTNFFCSCVCFITKIWIRIERI